MNTIKKTVLFSLAIALFIHVVPAQSVVKLKEVYTGDVAWNGNTKTVTFNTTGTMDFPNRELLYNNVLILPDSVKHVVIGKSVTVTGKFYANYTCLIKSMDWETPVVIGTPEQVYIKQSTGFSAFYTAESKERNMALTVKRLIRLNQKFNI